MKILILICDYMPDSKKVTAKMFHELAKEFVKSGHEVACITPKQDCPEKCSDLDGVTIYRFNSGRVKNSNFIIRLWNELQFSRKAWRLINSNSSINPDLVIWTSPSIFWGKCVRKLVSKFKIPSYLVLRDFFPQWIIDKGMIRDNSLLAKFFRYYEKINYESASKIGVMSPNNIIAFNTMTSSRFSNKVEVLYNWVDKNFLNEIQPSKSFRDNHNLKNKIVFIYGGNIGLAQDMMNIVRLVKRAQDIPNAFFVLIGQGDEYPLVEREISNHELNNILLLPAMPQNEYYSIQKVCDVGLFSLHRNHKTHNFPGKILGYMAQGMPILGSLNPCNDLENIINEGQAGFVCDNGNDDQFYENCKRLCCDIELKSHFSNNSMKLIDKYFSVRSAVEKIINEA